MKFLEDYKISTLNNGLKIITTEMPYMQSVAIGVWVHCGLRYEPKRLHGISHFIEHLVFKGTRKRGGEEIFQSIEGIGGILNASTGEEATFYYVQVAKDEFSFAIEVLLDMVINAAFRAEYLEKQKDIIVEEIHMYDDKPSCIVEDLFNELLWKNHPLGRKILGTEKSIRSISRNDIVEFKNKMYTSNNCVISVAGNVEHDLVVEEVKKSGRNFRRKGAKRFIPALDTQRQPGLIVHKKDTEQSHILLGVKTFHREHPDRFGLKLLSTILGENMSSRLFREVREEKGLAYSISTGIDRYLDTGCFFVSAGVVNEKIKNAVKLILKELEKIRSKKVGKNELERAKEYLRGQLSMGIEKTMSNMVWAGENLLLSKKVIPPHQIIDRLNRVTADDIQRIANKILKHSKLNLAVVGPVSNENQLRESLKLSS